MTQQPPRPGDIVNGHVLGADARWYPTTTQSSSVVEPSASTRKSTYGEKWRRRWTKCLVIAVTVAVLAVLVTDASHPENATGLGIGIDVLISAVVIGPIYGLLLCAIASAFPGRSSANAGAESVQVSAEG